MNNRIASVRRVCIVGIAIALVGEVGLDTPALAQVIPAEGFTVEVFATNVQPQNQQGPVGLAFDSQGNLYVATGGFLKILKIPAGTNTPEEFGAVPINDADGVAVDSQDNIIVSGRPVTKFDQNGDVIWTRTCPAGNIQGAAVDIDSSNNVFIGSLGAQICKIPPDGSSVTLLGSFDQPSELAVSRDGFLYVSQLGSGTSNIVKATLDTALILDVVASGLRAAQPVFDAAGDLFVGDVDTGRVLRISIPGGAITTVASGFTVPRGLAFDGQGNLFVADSTEKVIYKISPAGCGTLLVQVNEHTVGGGQGSTIVGIEGLQLCVFDKSAGSCARNIGISRRHYPEIFNECDPVACATTDADGAAGIILDVGDYVLIGEYDPDGFPPNEDGDELFIGVSASDFQCAVDGDPNTVTMRKHLQVIILPNGRTVGVDPHGGGRGRSTENEWVEITNVTGPDDSISVTAVDEDLRAAPGLYKAIGTAIGIDSSLSPGQLFMTILIPFHAEDLPGSEPLSVDLTYYNRSTGSWELAVGGNDQPSPDHGLDLIGDRFAVVDSTIPVLSDELGDYGVFWNPDLQEGFVWANVDYTAEFASARQPQAGAIPTVSEWGLVALILLMLTGIAIKFGRRRAAA